MASRKDDKDTPERADAGEEMGRAADTARRAGERTARAGVETASGAVREAGDIGADQADRIRGLLGSSARAYRDLAADGDMDAILQTGARLARGMQDVGWEVMQFSQTSLRMQLRAANDLMSCRSIEDMVQVQQDLVREGMDTLLQEGARLLEISSNVATDALGPLSHQRQGSERRQ